jgi:hypothetical protein
LSFPAALRLKEILAEEKKWDRTGVFGVVVIVRLRFFWACQNCGSTPGDSLQQTETAIAE